MDMGCVDEFKGYFGGRISGTWLDSITRERYFKFDFKILSSENMILEWDGEDEKECIMSSALDMLNLWFSWAPDPELLLHTGDVLHGSRGLLPRTQRSVSPRQLCKAVSNLCTLSSGSPNSTTITGHFWKVIFSRIPLRKVMLLACDFDVRC